MSDKTKIIISIVIVLIICIVIVGSIYLYKYLTRKAFFIDMNDVESIVYYSESEEIVYSEILDNITSKYNTAKNIKKVDRKRDKEMPAAYMQVNFFDGSYAIIVDNYIQFEDMGFEFEYTIEDLLKS